MKVCPLCRQTYKKDMQFCPADGAQLAVYTPNKGIYPGQILEDRYEIQRKIHEHGHWTVYLGVERASNRKIVLKTKSIPKGKDISIFHRKMEKLQQMSHPGIISLIDFGIVNEDFLYVVTEYVEGKSIKKLLEDAGAFSLRLSLTITKQLLSILHYLHECQILHLALTTSKVILSQSEQGMNFVKLNLVGDPFFDFSRLSTKESETALLDFSSNYMAPELFCGQRANSSCDIYSLGVIFYEMITGVLPFPQGILLRQQKTHAPAPPPIRRIKPNSEISRKLEKIIFKAIRWKSKKRFQTIEKFQDALMNATETCWKLKVACILLLGLLAIPLGWKKSREASWKFIKKSYLYITNSQELENKKIVNKKLEELPKKLYEKYKLDIHPKKWSAKGFLLAEEIRYPNLLHFKLQYREPLVYPIIHNTFHPILNLRKTEKLVNYIQKQARTEELSKSTIQLFNRVILGTNLYQTFVFSDIPLSLEAKLSLKNNPKGIPLVRLNRILLEDAFPEEIAKTPLRKMYYVPATKDRKAFYADIYKVNNSEFKNFVDELDCKYSPEAWFSGQVPKAILTKPVRVNWFYANLYALRQGKTLPKKAQWARFLYNVSKKLKSQVKILEKGQKRNFFHPLNGGKEEELKRKKLLKWKKENLIPDIKDNVWEWCECWFHEDYKQDKVIMKGNLPEIGDLTTSATKDGFYPHVSHNIEFRCVRVIED